VKVPPDETTSVLGLGGAVFHREVVLLCYISVLIS
jgi:hypothetical protein